MFGNHWHLQRYGPMIDCIPDNTGEQCLNCGWQKPERIKGWPRRNCQNSPDLKPAADKLGLPDPIPPSMAQHLAAWLAAGMPERTAEEQQTIAANGCESRRENGICNALGCNGSNKTIKCEWLIRMQTANCPKNHFGSNREAARQELATALAASP